ncbi:sugar ABC transporter permease [Cellulomonas sp. ES6]|uniref:carbohydrate ABC transporter permease n=1 Tax=Cellulomonas sp. ES6 TaxID=3039384 RepID=UPI0024B69CEC|nr:sugar ABC transporter permease [Cellulomonas sp. ES6]WHP16011.1 sugar ABC transporter permease [Cellulomonas sp. ES6]
MALATGAARLRPRSAARRPSRGGTRTSRGHEARTAAWMVAPAATLLVVFLVVPVVLAFVLAFTNARLISPRPASFVGLHNFATLWGDPVFWASLRNTVVFAAVVVPVQAGLALVLALLVNAKVRGTNIFRTLYFVPVVTSMVVVSLLWRFLYQKDGLLNAMITVVHPSYQPVDWLNDTRTALPAIILMSIWQAVGFHMIIWLSGLQTIPGELYEAGDLDGATGWKRFRYITWPCLAATRTFILITITIAALSLFTQINVMTQGGPLDSTTTVVYMAVRTGYQQLATGYASAISLVFFVLVLVVSGVQRFLTRDKD